MQVRRGRPFGAVLAPRQSGGERTDAVQRPHLLVTFARWTQGGHPGPLLQRHVEFSSRLPRCSAHFTDQWQHDRSIRCYVSAAPLERAARIPRHLPLHSQKYVKHDLSEPRLSFRVAQSTSFKARLDRWPRQRRATPEGLICMFYLMSSGCFSARCAPR